MKKTLTIGGKKVTFENSAITPRIYKQQFGRDYFEDLAGVATVADAMDAIQGGGFGALASKRINLDILENLPWACAATANPDTPDIDEWLRENPEFNRFTHGTEVLGMIMDTFTPKKK